MSLAPYPVPADKEGTQACAGDDTLKFFPATGLHGDAVEQIKDICRRCPFYDPCLAYALDRPTTYGIWGGTTHQERAEIRSRRRRTA